MDLTRLVQKTACVTALVFTSPLFASTAIGPNQSLTISSDAPSQYTLDAGASLSNQSTLSNPSQTALIGLVTPASTNAIQINNTASGTIGQMGQSYPAIDFSQASGPIPSVLINNAGNIQGSVNLGAGTSSRFTAQAGTSLPLITSSNAVPAGTVLVAGSGVTSNAGISNIASASILAQASLTLANGSWAPSSFTNAGTYNQTGGSLDCTDFYNQGLIQGTVSLNSSNQNVHLQTGSSLDPNSLAGFTGTNFANQTIYIPSSLTVAGNGQQWNFAYYIDTIQLDNPGTRFALGDYLQVIYGQNFNINPGTSFVSSGQNGFINFATINLFGNCTGGATALSVDTLNVFANATLTNTDSGSMVGIINLIVDNAGSQFDLNTGLTNLASLTSQVGSHMRLAADLINDPNGPRPTRGNYANITNQGRIDILQSRQTPGSLTNASTATIAFTLTNASQYDNLTLNNTVAFANGAVIEISLMNNGAGINNADVFNLINYQNGSTGAPTLSYVNPVPGLTFTLQNTTQPDSSGSWQVVAQKTSHPSSILQDALPGSLPFALASLPTSGSDVQLLLMQLQSANSTQAISLINQFNVSDSHSNNLSVSQALQNTSINNVVLRLDGLGSAARAPSSFQGRHVDQHWLHQLHKQGVFVSNPSSQAGDIQVTPLILNNQIHQRAQANTTSYHAQARGVGVLLDRTWGGQHVGVGLTSSSTRLKTDELYQSWQRIRSLQILGYSRRQMGQWALDGISSWTLNKNHVRKITSLAQMVDSRYAAQLLTAQMRLSYGIERGAWVLSPLGLLQAAYLSQEAYVQTGAGSFNQKVASLRTLSSAAGIGGTMTYGRETLFATFRGLYQRDLKSSNKQVISSFDLNNIPLTSTGGPVVKSTWIAGCGLSWLKNGVLYTLDYDLEMHQGFRNHANVLKARFTY